MSGRKTLVWSMLILAAGLQLPLSATTVLSVSGAGLGPFEVGRDQYLAGSWSQTGSYTDSSIAAELYGQGVGTAYLVTQIGPGATTAQQVARALFPFPSRSVQQSLFSGLTLGPGTYYLVLTAEGSSGGADIGGWFGAVNGVPSIPNPVITTDAGVMHNSDYAVFVGGPSLPYSPYPPASAFTAETDLPLALQYTVVAVPEPASELLLGAGFASVFFALRRRKRTGVWIAPLAMQGQPTVVPEAANTTPAVRLHACTARKPRLLQK